MGAFGLNTGMLDVDALGEALIVVLKEGRSDQILDAYSEERRKVFQFFVDLTSTQNTLRLHIHPPEVAAQRDWYFRILANPTEGEMLELMQPYFGAWRTDMRKVCQDADPSWTKRRNDDLEC